MEVSGLVEKWNQMPRWQKWIVALLSGALIFGALYWFKVQPLKEQLAVKKQQAERLALVVSKLRAVEKRKEKLEKEIEELNQQIAQIEAKLPTGKEEVSQILKSITDADSGMVITSIVRGKEEDREYYIAYPYRVKLKGKYPNFVAWCERLSQADRIINFGGIEVKSLQEEEELEPTEEKAQDYTIETTLEIKAFTLKR